MLNRFCILAGVVLWAGLAGNASADLESEMADLLSGANLKDTRVSILVEDLQTGQVLADILPDEPMVPASNMKLVTTAAALTRLGPDFKFTTSLRMLPEGDAVAQGSDEGSGAVLMIKADGDPAFGDPALLGQAGFDTVDAFLELWVDAVVDSGVKEFDALLVDDRVFDQQFVHPDWPSYDLPRRWCAQIAGLSFYNNVLDVRPIPSDKQGAAPIVQIYPYHPQLQTLNRARTTRIDDFKIDRKMGSNKFVFSGSVRNRRTYPFQVTVHDPPIFFAEYFAYLLKQKGVEVGRVERVEPSANLPMGQTLHEVNTTLAGVVDRTNQDSQNMFAESLLKRMGHELTGAPGSFDNGTAAVRLFLRDALSGRVGLAGIQVADGSGMSRNNKVTARMLVELLEKMYKDPTLGSAFTASLAHAGHTGTLRKRMKDFQADVYAKSGYLGKSADYASTLSGYLVVAPSPGQREPQVYAFSLMFNGFGPAISNSRIKIVQEQLLGLLDKRVSPQPAESH